MLYQMQLNRSAEVKPNTIEASKSNPIKNGKKIENYTEFKKRLFLDPIF